MLTLNTIYQYVFNNLAIISTKKIQKFPADQRMQLCIKIERIIRNKFTPITTGPQKDNFRKLLRKFNNTHLETLLFNNATDEVDISTLHFPSIAEIKSAFITLDSKYGYFKQDSVNTVNNFIRMFQACKLIADYVENNKTDHDEIVAVHAYKILVLFACKNTKNPFSSIQRFIRQFNYSSASHPVHDALIREIPIHDPKTDLSFWRQIIGKHGPKAVGYFQIAPEINKYLGKSPATFEEIKSTALKLRYQRYDESVELAELCHYYHVSEDIYNRCLEIKPLLKKKDTLPDVMIDGSEVGHPGYFLVKLPHSDPRAYIIGHITQCCMYVGGGAQTVIYDALTKESCGIYVLLKANNAKYLSKPLLTQSNPDSPSAINYTDYTIVGCGYAWLSIQGNLTFDSWENVMPESENPVIVALLKKFSEIATQQTTIERVTIGTGGRTPKEFSLRTYTEIIQEGSPYPDSYVQALVYVDPGKIALLPKLKSSLLDQAEKARLFSSITKERFSKMLDLIPDSTGYLELLRKVFLDHDRHKIWEMILGGDNDKKQDILVNQVCTSYGSFLDLLLQCFELNILNAENYDLLIKEQFNTPACLSSFRTLKDTLQEIKSISIDASFLKPLLEMLKLHSIFAVQHMLLELHEIDLLDNEILCKLIHNPEFVKQLAWIGTFLATLNLFNRDNVNAILKYPDIVDKIFIVLVLHKTINMLDRDNIRNIVEITANNINNVESLWESLKLLHQSEYIDFKIFSLCINLEKQSSSILYSLIGHFAREDVKIYLEKISSLNKELLDGICQGLYLLKEANILDREIAECSLKNMHIAKEILFVFIRLHIAQTLNNEYRQLILDYPDQCTCIADSINTLTWSKLLNSSSHHFIRHNLQFIREVSFALERLDANAKEHRDKDIFANFINYYTKNDKVFNRSELICEWVKSYISEFASNPFSLLQQQDKSNQNPTLFKPAADSIQAFEAFLVGEELSPDLKSLMYGIQRVADRDIASKTSAV